MVRDGGASNSFLHELNARAESNKGKNIFFIDPDFKF
jgi:hypothetical protein